MVAQGFERKVFYIHAVNRNGAFRHVIKARQQADDGGFTAARIAYQRHRSAHGNRQVDVFEHIHARFVRKRHIVKANVFAHRRQRDRAGLIGNFGFQGEQFKNTVNGQEGFFDVHVIVPHRFDRGVEHQKRRHERGKVTAGNRTVHNHRAALPEHQRQPQRHDKMHHRRQPARMFDHPHIQVEYVIHQLVKASFLVVLQVVGGHGAVAVEHFVIGAHGNGVDDHRVAHQFFQFAAHNKNKRPRHRERPHRNHRQLPRVVEQYKNKRNAGKHPRHHHAQIVD